MVIETVKAVLFMKQDSKRVPKKNMHMLCGRPLFHWIVDELSQSSYIKEIIINTDSDEIATSASAHFDVTIHFRPDYLKTIKTDEATQLLAYDLEQSEGEYFLNAHSTTPLMRRETIDRSIEYFFKQSDKSSLMSVTPKYKRFYKMNGEAINHVPGRMVPTQELEPVYEENSCIYLFSRNSFEKNKSRVGTRPTFFPIGPIESIDIDEPEDFELVEYFMKRRLEGQDIYGSL